VNESHRLVHQPQYLAGLSLPQGLAPGLPTHVHPFQLLHTHLHRPLTDHATPNERNKSAQEAISTLAKAGALMLRLHEEFQRYLNEKNRYAQTS
jgi:hypothetical protein